MRYNIQLSFVIPGSRHQVNQAFRTLRCGIQAGDRFCYDFFLADEHDTHSQNYLSFTWKDIKSKFPYWLEEQKDIEGQVGKMCSHLQTQIRSVFLEQSRTLAIEVEIYEQKIHS